MQNSPASPEQCKSALRALFSTFATGDKGDPADIIAAYLVACSGYPIAAIERAVIRFIRGEVESHDGRFLPTSAELGREIAKQYVSMSAQSAMSGPMKRVAWRPEKPRDEPDQDSKDRVREALRNLKQRLAQSQLENAR